MTVLSPSDLARDLSIPDLTDPARGPHAVQLLLHDIEAALADAWGCPRQVIRDGPIVSLEDCYDRLGFAPAAVTRDRRYTRYVSETCMLRSHTSAMIPPQLRRLATGGYLADVVLICPGIVFRRDVIDRVHTGTPHQVDLWRLTRQARCGAADLRAMVEVVTAALLPGRTWRTVPASHPYTVDGCQIDVRDGSEWVEIGECGVAAPPVLARAGLGDVSGLAMGLGLDRMLMLRKGIPDIRLLRSRDPRVADQMRDLSAFRPVSAQPAIERDISFAVDEAATAETLGDQVRDALGSESGCVESVLIVSETSPAAVPPAAARRLRIRPGQKNVLLRVVFRDLDRTLTATEANELRDRVFAAVHQGGEDVPSWAMMTP